MLVDAGENDQADTVVSYLKGQGVETLDYVIGTHPHSDHIGGLDTVSYTHLHFPLPSDLCCPSYAKWFDAGARFARATLAKL